MAVKLHRCSILWIKGPHPCWRVQKALDEAGVDYELVKHHPLRGRRKEYEQLTGQRLLPAIELEDGRIIREESAALAEKVKSGTLFGPEPPA